MKNEIGPFKDEFKFLSNFYYIPGGMVFDGIWIPTSEHAYQMMKATNEKDKLYIAESKTPVASKKLGNEINCIEGWTEIKLDVMRLILHEKFKSQLMREMLRLTNGFELVEYN